MIAFDSFYCQLLLNSEKSLNFVNQSTSKKKHNGL